MNLLSIVLAILVAILSSTFLINPNTLLTTFLPPNIVTKFIPYNIDRGHRHRKRPDHRKKVSICDDFPKDFAPPDTNTTSYFCVDRNGCCNFTSVQSAVDAVPNLSLKRNIVLINSGIYYEKVTVPKTKPNITFQGQGYTSTAIAWNDTAKSANGTFYSGSVQVFASNFMAKNISFMNVAPIPSPGDVGAQAVAIRISGDQSAFFGCGFFGAQDTLHDDRGRHYFKDCHIQGSIDFIFGNARSFYENCQLISMANPVAPGSKAINGAVTAHGRASKDENSGFAFVNCTVGGTGRIWLGRAWRPFSRVVFLFASMTDIIAPEGWNDFNDPTRDQTVFYGEYNCTGAGSDMTMRAPYVQRLNDTQASLFLNISFIDGDQWLQSYNN
ncbi:putative pectinesterase 8 [Citrus sinensis]|uniref:probable pectinesterase 8 n=1 Tax=Citrus sinensis TaxID=2711 RepID=UPI0003D74BDA|nr:probable pectinesterase 8 [Citrus sinensis]KAH9673766.1 putative pectinesterase 8 [Citrus sinensis]